MITQLHMWYIINTKEKISIKAHFLEPWRDMPDVNIKTFTYQLDMCQVEYKDHGTKFTKADKVDHFVSQMYDYDLF